MTNLNFIRIVNITGLELTYLTDIIIASLKFNLDLSNITYSIDKINIRISNNLINSKLSLNLAELKLLKQYSCIIKWTNLV